VRVTCTLVFSLLRVKPNFTRRLHALSVCVCC